MKILTEYIAQIEFSAMQMHQNMIVFPILHAKISSIEYITLKEALEKGDLYIKEVDEEGSVPELKVINKGDIPVLMLDGEELVGAKQNRVLNTSILLKEKSETVIPVSCTESGRWSFKSEHFKDSGVVMSASARRAKNYSVSESLLKEKSFRSNQGRVWEEIDVLAMKAEVHSSTSAMKDVFEKRKKEIDEYVNNFKIVPHQRGLFVMINGEVVGFDILSSEDAYSKLHQKLVKSYSMEAWLSKKESKGKLSIDKEKIRNKAQSFLNKIRDVTWKRFESVGYGWDYRYKGKDTVGSVLLYNEDVIHMSFFRIPEEEYDVNMKDSRTRMMNRYGLIM